MAHSKQEKYTKSFKSSAEMLVFKFDDFACKPHLQIKKLHLQSQINCLMTQNVQRIN